jgi:hypothetical protein
LPVERLLHLQRNINKKYRPLHMEAGISIPSRKKSGKNLQVCGKFRTKCHDLKTHMQKFWQKLDGVW